MARAWQHALRTDLSPSATQALVQGGLAELGVASVPEYLGSAYSLDMALLPLDRQVGVEVDGPTHFFCNEPALPTGRTLFKRRQLRAMGWAVVSVSVVEAREALARGALRTFLAHTLQQAGVALR